MKLDAASLIVNLTFRGFRTKFLKNTILHHKQGLGVVWGRETAQLKNGVVQEGRAPKVKNGQGMGVVWGGSPPAKKSGWSGKGKSPPSEEDWAGYGGRPGGKLSSQKKGWSMREEVVLRKRSNWMFLTKTTRKCSVKFVVISKILK